MCIVPHVRICTCGASVVFDVLILVKDKCEEFASAVARMCVQYSDMSHVYVHI